MASDALFRLVLATLVLGALSISIYFRRKAGYMSDDSVSRKDEGKPILILRSVGGILLWLATLTYAINPTWMAWSTVQLPTALRWVGAVIGLLMVPMFYWVFSTLGRNITDTVVTRAEHTLVTHGPYRWVRHPLYSFGMVFFLGLSLLAESWFLAAGIVGMFAFLAARTRIEEAKLIERFGDEYRDYMKRTGRYVPRLVR